MFFLIAFRLVSFRFVLNIFCLISALSLIYLLSSFIFLLFLQAGNLHFWVLFAKQTVNFSLFFFHFRFLFHFLCVSAFVSCAPANSLICFCYYYYIYFFFALREFFRLCVCAVCLSFKDAIPMRDIFSHFQGISSNCTSSPHPLGLLD